MSILGMDLQLKSKTFGGDISFFDSQQMRFIRGGATIDSTKVGAGYTVIEGVQTRKIVPAGTFMAALAGKFAPAKIAELAVDTVAASADITVTNAKPFAANDTITIDGTAKTILSINYATNVITLTATAGAIIAAGKSVIASGAIAGLATAAFLSTEAVEVTEGDSVTTGIDEGRVIAARLPIAPVALVKTQLNHIKFV